MCCKYLAEVNTSVLLNMDLPDVAEPVLYSFGALLWGLDLLSCSCHRWASSGHKEGAREYYRLCIYVFGRGTLLRQLLFTISIMIAEYVLCFAMLFRICLAYDDPDVLSQPALADTIGTILVIWLLISTATLIYLENIAGGVYVAMGCVFEHNRAPRDVESQLDLESLPLLYSEEAQNTDLGPVDIEHVPSDWASDYGTLIPSTPGSRHSDSSPTLCSFGNHSDSDSDSGLSSISASRPEYVSFLDQPPDVRATMATMAVQRRFRSIRRGYGEASLLDLDIGSDTQSLLPNTDDEMDLPVPSLDGFNMQNYGSRSEQFDADDEMDSESSDSEHEERL